MGRFVIKQARNGLYFDLQAGNYETIASSEIYSSDASCRKGIESVIRNAPIASVEDQTKENFSTRKNPKFEIYQDRTGHFRFRLKAKNGEIIATSEGYKAKASCINGIKSVMKNAINAQVVYKID